MQITNTLTQMLNVLLVNPKFPTSFWGFQHTQPFYGGRTAFPPLNLMTISGLLPQSWSQKLVDENVRPVTDEQLQWADIVMVTAMLVQEDSAAKIIHRAKAMGKKVAFGGPFVSTHNGNLPPADYIFKGEVEVTLPEFINDLSLGIPEKVYEADPKNLPDLELTPIPNYGLINMRDYGCMSIQHSRGCPFNCDFCDIPGMYGNVPRTKGIKQFLSELDHLLDVGWRGPLFIVDDNFIGNKKNIRLLMPHLITWQMQHNYPFALFTEASVNLADDDELLKNMHMAGFNRVFLGIETPDEESLKAAQKKQNVAHGNLVESVRKIRSYGIDVMAGFIVGFDNEESTIYDRMIEFVNQTGISHAMVGMLQALPNTPLWNKLNKQGRLLPDQKGNPGDIYSKPNYVTTMDADELVAGLKHVHRTLYAPRNFYDRALRSFDGFSPDFPLINRSCQGFKEQLGSFLRIVTHIGMKEKGRLEFWRFIAKTVRRYPQMLPEALAHSVCGHHFRKLLQE